MGRGGRLTGGGEGGGGGRLTGGGEGGLRPTGGGEGGSLCSRSRPGRG